jgi:hypothetical protein
MSGILNQLTQWSGWGWSGWGWSGWIALGSVGTLAAVVVALLAGFGRIGPRARLEVFIDPGPPGEVRIRSVSGFGSFASYYCRLRVENRGTAVADGVEVQMLELRKRNSSGAMVLDPVFLPLDLKWSFDQEQRPRLLPGVHRFCDLVHVDDPDAVEGRQLLLVFHSSMFPAYPNELRVGEYPTLKPPGDYELEIGVAGMNAKTIRRTISIRFEDWYDHEAEMFSKGLVVRRK